MNAALTGLRNSAAAGQRQLYRALIPPREWRAKCSVKEGMDVQLEKTTPEPPRRTKKKRILTPEDWIDAAIDLLVSKSIDAVRVESLAKELGITVGSFYYHFKDRNDLLSKLLKRWHELTTAQVIRTIEGRSFTVEEALGEVLSLPFHGRSARRAAMIEFAIRAWARHDEMARQAVREVDEQRLSYYTRAFQDAGFNKSQAENRAFTVYSFQLSQSLLWELNDDMARKKLMHFTKELLLAPADSK